MAGQNILLDAEICYWVLLPVVFILLCVGVVRHYATVLMTSKPAVNVKRAVEAQTVNYCRILRVNGAVLPHTSLLNRVEKQVNPHDGVLTRPQEKADPMAAMSDPSMMGDMMKKNVMMIVPNIAMMQLISTFFSGFVMAKFPFPLSARFKGMVQRGVDIDDLDGAYATSMSLYFLILFGLQGFQQLLLGGAAQGDDMAAMANPMAAAQQQPGQDAQKLFDAAKEELQFAADQHECALDNACLLLLQGR